MVHRSRLNGGDLNGDGTITADGDRKVIGNANPKFTGGWTNQFSYKNIDLSIFVNFVVGNDIYNANKIEWTGRRFWQFEYAEYDERQRDKY